MESLGAIRTKARKTMIRTAPEKRTKHSSRSIKTCLVRGPGHNDLSYTPFKSSEF